MAAIFMSVAYAYILEFFAHLYNTEKMPPKPLPKQYGKKCF